MAAVSRAVATGRRMERREGLAMAPRPLGSSAPGGRDRRPPLRLLAHERLPAMTTVGSALHQLGELFPLIGREDRRHLPERARAHLDALGHQPLHVILLGLDGLIVGT